MGERGGAQSEMLGEPREKENLALVHNCFLPSRFLRGALLMANKVCRVEAGCLFPKWDTSKTLTLQDKFLALCW